MKENLTNLVACSRLRHIKVTVVFTISQKKFFIRLCLLPVIILNLSHEQ